MHLHTFVDRERKRSKNGDEGVVLEVIQSPEILAPNGRHLRVQHTYGQRDVSSFLIQQGEGEVDEDPVARRRGGGCSRDPAGLRQAPAGGGGGARGREAPRCRFRLPFLPSTIYRG